VEREEEEEGSHTSDYAKCDSGLSHMVLRLEHFGHLP